MSLDTAIKDMQKAFGKHAVGSARDLVKSKGSYSTGCLQLDAKLGGGFPKGMLSEIYGPYSSGKAQPLYSKILTPDGWIYMRDVKLGQVVCTPDGGVSNVIGIFPQGEQDIYEITFDDKSTAHCTLDHLWTVKTRHSDLWQTLTTKDLLSKGLVDTQGKGKFSIPESKAQEFSHKNLPVNPYLLGLLLGDGGLTDSSVNISTKDKETLDNISKILISDLRSLGVWGKYSYEKQIPHDYLYSSVSQRKELLRGLMDSDGYIGESGSMSFTTTSKFLSLQFNELCKSLGLRVRTSNRVTAYTNSSDKKVDGRESYRSSILFTSNAAFEICKLSRKVSRLKLNQSTPSLRYISSIKKVGSFEAQCIKIGHPDELYITDNYVVTHNTTACIHAIVDAQNKGDKVIFVDLEGTFDKVYAHSLGVDIDDLIYIPSNAGERALQIAEKLCKTGEIGLIIIDSVAALLPEKIGEDDYGKANMAFHAKLVGEFVKRFVPVQSRHNIAVVAVNQIRLKPGVSFGNPEYTTGGEALPFYAAVRLDIRKSGSVEKDKEGNVIAEPRKVKIVKSKINSSVNQTLMVDIIYGEGFDQVGEVVDVATDLEIIKKSGAWYSYEDAKIAQGRMQAKQFMRDNPEVYEIIRQQVWDHLFIELSADAEV